MKICLISSSGGHFFQLYRLKSVWQKYNHFWITFNREDVTSAIPKEKKYFAHYPDSRNIINAIKNFILALKIIPQEKPSHIISTGAGIAIPFFIIAKLFNIHTTSIFIEPIDFIKHPSLTGRLIYYFKLANLFLIQNKLQQKNYPKAKYWGNTL